MSTATKATRRISFGSLLATIFKIQLRSQFLSRKTLFLTIVNLLPVIGAVVYLATGGDSGGQLYKILAEFVVITFLVPIVCLFNGGPAVVEEIEGRTATYLFLRPASKPAIFLAKTAAAALVSVATVVVPMMLLFVVCMLAGGDFGQDIRFALQTIISSAIGCLSGTAVFAALGAVFARSLLAGLIFGACEFGLSFVPVLKFSTQNFHMRNAGNLVDPGHLSFIDRMVLSAPIDVPIWASYVSMVTIIFVAIAVGAYVFNERQYII